MEALRRRWRYLRQQRCKQCGQCLMEDDHSRFLIGLIRGLSGQTTDGSQRRPRRVADEQCFKISYPCPIKMSSLGKGLLENASSEECCIRKAVNERGLNSGPVGLADAISEDEAATGTAFALMWIEYMGKGRVLGRVPGDREVKNRTEAAAQRNHAEE